MLRRLAAIFAGIIAGFILVGLIGKISGTLFPPPEDLNMYDKEGILLHMRSLPPMAFIIVILSHLIGTFIASFISARLADKYKFYFGIFVGFLFVAASISNDLMLPHPLWMIVSDIILVLGAAYFGASLGSRAINQENTLNKNS